MKPYIYNIDINKLYLSNKNDLYKLSYNFNNNINIKYILTKINKFTVDYHDQYIHLYSENFGNFHLLNTFLRQNIFNFNGIFHKNDHGKLFIKLSINNYTRNIENHKCIFLYIKYVRKYNNIPIIHLLHGGE